jgi:hypothetical protein
MPDRLDIFMEPCLHLVLPEVIQQCWELYDLSFAILDGVSARSLEIEDEEVLQVFSRGSLGGILSVDGGRGS